MIVNTQNGHSESIDKIPLTSKKYVSKTRIKRTKIKDDDIIIGVKNEIIKYLKKKINKDDKEKVTIQDISVTEVKSIYKPYWVADFRGRNIYIEAQKVYRVYLQTSLDLYKDIYLEDFLVK